MPGAGILIIHVPCYCSETRNGPPDQPVSSMRPTEFSRSSDTRERLRCRNSISGTRLVEKALMRVCFCSFTRLCVLGGQRWFAMRGDICLGTRIAMLAASQREMVTMGGHAALGAGAAFGLRWPDWEAAKGAFSAASEAHRTKVRHNSSRYALFRDTLSRHMTRTR